MSRNAQYYMHAEFNKYHEVTPPNAASRVTTNSCIYPDLKIMLTFTLTLLLEIGSN